MKFEEIFYNKEGNNAEKYNTEENILYLSIKRKNGYLVWVTAHREARQKNKK